MTDNEIKKALECCKRDGIRNCVYCPYCGTNSCAELFSDAIDLINRQKEEIKRLQEKQTPQILYFEADGYADGVLCYDYAKCPVCGRDFEYNINDWGAKYCADCGQALDWGDNLVKEMTEELK